MSKVWDVSVKLGVDGEPHEKELAGELALGLALLLFELGNEVLSLSFSLSLSVCLSLSLSLCLCLSRARVGPGAAAQH